MVVNKLSRWRRQGVPNTAVFQVSPQAPRAVDITNLKHADLYAVTDALSLWIIVDLPLSVNEQAQVQSK